MSKIQTFKGLKSINFKKNGAEELKDKAMIYKGNYTIEQDNSALENSVELIDAML